MPAEDDKFICVLSVTDDTGVAREVLVLSRSGEGYACVCSITDRKDPTRVLNRTPTKRDYDCVMLAATQVAGAFLRLGMFPSLELLGNNSHGIGPEGGLELGNAREPFAPHVHVIGRGDPKRCYLGRVPLRGAPPGDVMVPRRRGEPFASAEEQRAVASGLAASLDNVNLHPSVQIVERRSENESGFW